MKPVDAHCHLDFKKFDDDRENVIERCKKSLQFVVNAGSNLKHNKAALKLQRNYPETVKANLGLHPTYTDSFDEVEDIKKQIREEDPVAVGEIGLDHHHVTEESLRDKQKHVFRELLELAEELDKPVVIHSRDAESEAVEILKEYNLPEVFLHCFNGSPELAEEAVEHGMTIGITTQVIYSNRVQEIVKTLETESMVLETDSPFLYRGERNEPVNVLESAERIADINSVDVKEVVDNTTKNAVRIFG